RPPVHLYGAETDVRGGGGADLSPALSDDREDRDGAGGARPPRSAVLSSGAVREGGEDQREEVVVTEHGGRMERETPRGAQRVAGVDEAGRGSLAGPVVAAAGVFPRGGETRLPGLP